MDRRFIGFRLRKHLDDDILQAIGELDSQKKSELARLGMRMALGITSQKVMEVKIQPVPVTGVKLFFKDNKAKR